ncbi:BMF factor, partial [Oxylabes madagascariensis]|nr:BMF factor [Oxylabes madagascariensis]
MDRPSYLEEDYSSLDGLDDDVFHSDDFGLAGQPGEMTATGFFTQNQSYSCLLGRFQLFPLTHCCGPGIRHPEQQDKATQTLSPSSSSQDVMLPCGVTEEPRRLFYGKSTPVLTITATGFSSPWNTNACIHTGCGQTARHVPVCLKLMTLKVSRRKSYFPLKHQQNRNQVWWQLFLFLHNLALNTEVNRNHTGQR